MESEAECESQTREALSLLQVYTDKISHPESLRAAWQQVRANAGAAGVDGMNFAQIEHQGLEGWLEKLGTELRNKTYRCQGGAPGLHPQSQR
jgi:hypothetical protein